MEADILAPEARVSVAAETLEEEARVLAGEVRVSVAVEILEEARALVALDTSAVAFCILVRALSVFHHPERASLK